jgi:hypothetical protein
MWFGKSPPRAPRPTMAQWNAHFLTIQGRNDAQPLITSTDIKGLLVKISGELNFDGANALYEGDPAMRERGRALFKVELALHEVKPKPGPVDKRAVCPRCGTELGAAIAIVELHIATLCTDDHPLREEMIVKYSNSKTAAHRLGKEPLAKLKEAAAAIAENQRVVTMGKRAPLSDATGAASETAPAKRNGIGAGGIHAHTDRALSAAEIRAIDEAAALFIFAEGLPLNTINSPFLHALFRELHSSSSEKSMLTDWSIRHLFLVNAYE